MHLHLDCQFGMAGDMVLAALIDAGADQEAIVEALRGIPLEGFDLECRRTARNGVAAMLADVVDVTGVERQGKHTHDHEHHHGHKHHDHAHGHHHDHKHDHAHGGPHRHLGDLLALLDAPGIASRVKERASRVFRILAEAEATVHGQDMDKVHFHEISGIDTAVDVIGSCLALELLDIDTVSAAAPAVGSGMLMCEHGIFPLPAPATLEILKRHNIPWQAGGEGERTTPTGVALLAALAERFGDAPELTVTRIGYGAGHREYEDVPNLLRAIIGKPGGPAERRRESRTVITEASPELSGDMIRVGGDKALLPAQIEAMLPGDVAADGDRVVEFRFVVDDMTPEAVAYLCERVLAAGALEAYGVAAVMKKSRLGHEITALSAIERAGSVADALWRESTTFGMRVGERNRLVLPRETGSVMVLGHKVRVKIGWRGGEVVRCQPEYEDCRAVALAEGRPFVEVFGLAEDAARDFAAEWRGGDMQ